MMSSYTRQQLLRPTNHFCLLWIKQGPYATVFYHLQIKLWSTQPIIKSSGIEPTWPSNLSFHALHMAIWSRCVDGLWLVLKDPVWQNPTTTPIFLNIIFCGIFLLFTVLNQMFTWEEKSRYDDPVAAHFFHLLKIIFPCKVFPLPC